MSNRNLSCRQRASNIKEMLLDIIFIVYPVILLNIFITAIIYAFCLVAGSRLTSDWKYPGIVIASALFGCLMVDEDDLPWYASIPIGIAISGILVWFCWLIKPL